MRLWKIGPKPLQNFMTYFTHHKTATKLLSLSEVALGLYLANNQRPHPRPSLQN
jgi:hypothetical protein